MTLSRQLHAALLVLGLLTAGLAQAANSYYLLIDGIPGESTNADHKSWIDISSFSWGLKLVTSSTGGGGTTGKASFSDLSWTQQVDISTPKWFLAVATGKDIPTVTLDVTRPNGTGRSDSFFQMIFTHTKGTALTISGDESLTEEAAMSSGETVKLRYRPQDAKGGYGQWVEGKFDLTGTNSQALFSGDERVLLGLFASGGAVSFDAGAVTTVPEPAGAALMLAGLGVLALPAFRRRRAR